MRERGRVHRPVSWALIVVVAVAVMLVGGAAGVDAAIPAKTRAKITIADFAFKPKTITVKAGTKIAIKNTDDTTHTLTANKGAFNAGEIDGGKSASITVKKPGTYAYHCQIHNFMMGTVKAT
jgi:plastocyanin